MQRWIWSTLAAGLVCGWGFSATAGDTVAEKPGTEYEKRLTRRHEELSRKAEADRLRFARARRRANERMAREEMFERMGYSPLRPFTPLSAMSLGTMGGPYSMSGHFGRPQTAR
jgi:hypothetical protein